jgi:hypothetical protein
MYMKVPQANSLCSYLKQAKMLFFPSFFSYTKSENRRMEQVMPEESGTGGKGDEVVNR